MLTQALRSWRMRAWWQSESRSTCRSPHQWLSQVNLKAQVVFDTCWRKLEELRTKVRVWKFTPAFADPLQSHWQH